MRMPSIRNRNPVNLRPGTAEVGQRYWDRHGFTGVDDRGFAQFDSLEGGLNAARQQLRVDTARGLTLGAFLDKFVGAEADTVGTANAKRNVPQLVGATLDTNLQEIDPDSLLRAMIVSEGGQENLQTYEPYLTTPADPQDRTGAWSDPGQGAEDRRRLKRRERYPDAYLAEQKRQDEARASAIPGRDPDLIDEYDRMGGQMETPVGPALPGGPNMMTPVGPVTAPAPEPLPDVRTSPDQPSAMSRFASPRIRQALESARQAQEPRYAGEVAETAEAIGDQFGTLEERERRRRERQGEAFRVGRDIDITASPETTIQRPTGEQETLNRQGVSESLQTIDPSAFVADQQRGMDSQLAGVDLEGMAPESPSFLSRLGSGIKDNPEVALQIAALLGGVGSGLMGRGRLAKQQAEQDAANRQAAAYANAISTLTRGRTTPAIAPRQVRSTPGTAETIMDVLGTLGQGGAQIMAGRRQQRQAEEDRQRAQAMEDFKMQYMTRGQDIEERGQDMDLMGQMLRASGGGGAGGAGGAAAPGANEIDVLDQVIDVAEQLYEGAPTGPVMGMFGTSPYSQYLESGQAASQYDGYRNIIKGQIAKLIGGSRPSDLDMNLADQIVPTRRDLSAPQKFNLLRQLNQFRRGQGMEGNIGHMIDPGGLTFAAGQTDMSMNYSAMSNSQLLQYATRNRDDEAAQAEMELRLRNKGQGN